MLYRALPSSRHYADLDNVSSRKNHVQGRGLEQTCGNYRWSKVIIKTCIWIELANSYNMLDKVVRKPPQRNSFKGKAWEICSSLLLENYVKGHCKRTVTKCWSGNLWLSCWTKIIEEGADRLLRTTVLDGSFWPWKEPQDICLPGKPNTLGFQSGVHLRNYVLRPEAADSIVDSCKLASCLLNRKFCLVQIGHKPFVVQDKLDARNLMLMIGNEDYSMRVWPSSRPHVQYITRSLKGLLKCCY